MVADLNNLLKEKYNYSNLVLGGFNYEVCLNRNLIDSVKLNRNDIVDDVVRFAKNIKGVDRAFPIDKLMDQPMSYKVKEMISNGWYPKRSGDVHLVLKPGWIDGGPTGTTHGLWNPYDSHIPLVWYGWGIKPGKSNQEVYMTDIAATLAAMLHIQMPSGNIGKPILSVLE
ncbi:MAG: alkaline phosphatase family protein, partial [Lacibacter sp.]